MEDVWVEVDSVWPGDGAGCWVDRGEREDAVGVDGGEDACESFGEVEFSDESVVEGDIEYASAEVFKFGW